MFHVILHRALVEPRAHVTSVEAGAGATTATLRIEGLLCSACAANVRNALERVQGVRSARVDLEAGEAVVTTEPDVVEPARLVEAVDETVVLRPARRLLARLGGLATRSAR